jgi:predicted metal-dependent hydrolase
LRVPSDMPHSLQFEDEKKQSTFIEGACVPYSVRISLRAKRARLEISRDKGLVVVLPEKYRSAEAPKIIAAKSSWVLRKLALLESEPKWRTHPSALKEGDLVPYCGRELTLMVQIKHGTDSETEIEQEGDTLRIAACPVAAAALSTALKRWYVRRAAELLPQRVDNWARMLGCLHHKLFIRDQKTRWGSCSCRRNLSLNWRLILMPREILDYVIVHELTHLEIPNHSRAFWKLIRERCPEYQDHRAWLRANGQRLLLW